MFSNLPTMLQQQDFQKSNRDMLEAARDGKTADPKSTGMYAGPSALLREATRRFGECARIDEIERERVRIWAESNWLLQNAIIEVGAKPTGAKIGAQFRIRLPESSVKDRY